jgi:hypothetical protein
MKSLDVSCPGLDPLKPEVLEDLILPAPNDLLALEANLPYLELTKSLRGLTFKLLIVNLLPI